MHCDRTEPTTLRHAPLARRGAASETAADGFAALLGAAAAPAERERPSARNDERGQAGTGTDERGASARHAERERTSESRGGDAAAGAGAAAATPTASERPATSMPGGIAAAPDLPEVIAAGAPGSATTGTGETVPVTTARSRIALGSASADGRVGLVATAATTATAGIASTAGTAAPLGDAAATAGTAAALGGAAATAAVPAPVGHELGLPAVGAHPAATPAGPAGAVPAPVAGTVPPAQPTPAGAATATDATAATDAPAHADAPGAELPTAAPRGDTTATPQPATNADARRAASEPAAVSAPPEQPTGPSAPPATATAASQPQPAAAQATPLADRATPLHRAPRAVAQVLELAVERGISHAKLRLRPADLGGVEIRLQTSAAGVTAQVVADSPEAARLLQEAAADLRRALERHDVTLLSLDVSTAGDDRFDGSAGAGNDPAGERDRHLAAHGLAPGGAGDQEDDQPAPVVATVQLPDGVHVDVLA